MRHFRKWVPYIIGSILLLLGLYVLCRGLLIAGENGWGGNGFFRKLPGKLEELAVDTYNGLLTWETEMETGENPGKSVGKKVVDALFPPMEETETTDLEKTENTEEAADSEKAVNQKEKESSEKTEQRKESANASKIIETVDSEKSDTLEKSEQEETELEEEKTSSEEGEIAASKSTEASDQQEVSEIETEKEETTITETEALSVSVFSNSVIPMLPADSLRQAPVALPWTSMKDFKFLLNQYFILDPSAGLEENLLDLDQLMGKDLTIDTDTEGPEILIYHTHSQEAFQDSRPGEIQDTIMGAGERLTEILTEQYGFEVLHHTGVYDMIDGKLDRSRAYNLAAVDIEAILKAYPSIQVVIDLHRDGVDDYHLAAEFNGKSVAQIMFFVGLSRTAGNGPVSYLPNPYIADNLALAFQLQMKAAEYYPGFTRNIYLQSLRYNQHLCPRSLLIEAGTQLNTVEEEYNAMSPLADILNQVLRGE